MKYKEEFDTILACNIFEHIFDTNKAIDNMYNALKPNGKLIVIVPARLYPWHDVDTGDYHRFSKQCLFNMFGDKFDIVDYKEYKFLGLIFSHFIELQKKV